MYSLQNSVFMIYHFQNRLPFPTIIQGLTFNLLFPVAGGVWRIVLTSLRAHFSGQVRAENRLGVLVTRLGVLVTRLGVLVTRLGVLVTRLGVLVTRIGVLVNRLGVLGTRLGVLVTRLIIQSDYNQFPQS